MKNILLFFKLACLNGKYNIGLGNLSSCKQGLKEDGKFNERVYVFPGNSSFVAKYFQVTYHNF